MLGAMMADDILRCKIFASLSLMKISITVHYQCVCVGEREEMRLTNAKTSTKKKKTSGTAHVYMPCESHYDSHTDGWYKRRSDRHGIVALHNAY